MKNLLLKSILIAGSALALNANAAIISGGSFTNAEQTTEINQSGNLNLFDSNLGNLTSVSFSFTGSGTTSFSVTNNAAQSQLARVDSSVELNYSSTNAAIAALLGTLTQPLVILSFTTGNQSYAPGETKNFGPFLDSDSANQIFTTALAAFQQPGGGVFNVNCQSLSGISIVGGGGNVNSSQSTLAGCGASISYTYSAHNVPEPASISMIGLGLAGISFLRRRKAA